VTPRAYKSRYAANNVVQNMIRGGSKAYCYWCKDCRAFHVGIDTGSWIHQRRFTCQR
jgi:hypothetical protein